MPPLRSGAGPGLPASASPWPAPATHRVVAGPRAPTTWRPHPWPRSIRAATPSTSPRRTAHRVRRARRSGQRPQAGPRRSRRRRARPPRRRQLLWQLRPAGPRQRCFRGDRRPAPPERAGHVAPTGCGRARATCRTRRCRPPSSSSACSWGSPSSRSPSGGTPGSGAHLAKRSRMRLRALPARYQAMCSSLRVWAQVNSTVEPSGRWSRQATG